MEPLREIVESSSRTFCNYCMREESTVVNFIFMAFVLFCLLKAINKLTSISHKAEEPKAPTTKKCPFCKTEIDIEATRCPHCTSVLEEAKKTDYL
mgnify:CR=1 FL=1